MALNVEPITLNNEVFHTMEYGNKVEKFILNGKYTMKRYLNPHPNLQKIIDDYCEIGGPSYFHAKQIYCLGNILYKCDAPEIEEMIDLLIKATYEMSLPSFVDNSVKTREQMKGGTICPTKEVAFRYKGKLFILYGRYIYGYNTPYVHFQNDKPKHEEKPDDEDENDSDYEDLDEEEDMYENEKEKDALLTTNEIILPMISYSEKDPKFRRYLTDHNYCLAIIDEATNVLEAFAIYR